MAFKTKAEKKAFRAGMANQYNKEHPDEIAGAKK